MIVKRQGIFNVLILGMLIVIGMAVAALPILTRDEQTPINWMTALLSMGPFLVLTVLIIHNRRVIRNLRSQLFHTKTRLQHAKSKLDQTQRQLQDASQMAGATELATGILHNVGNVLNGVNVSVSQLTQTQHESRMSALDSIVKLMVEQGPNLPVFIASDQRGQNLVQALAQLEQIRQEESEDFANELRELAKGVGHMRNIIDMQQSTARQTHQHEAFDITGVINDALQLYTNAFERLNITLNLNLDERLLAQTDRPSVIHILVNLISNARNAIAESNLDGPRQITIESSTDTQWIEIKVTDTGNGIEPVNLKHLFEYGFTTRKTGHGFGLHHSINAARELGGTLTAHSDGAGCGATFILRLPAMELSSEPTIFATIHP